MILYTMKTNEFIMKRKSAGTQRKTYDLERQLNSIDN